MRLLDKLNKRLNKLIQEAAKDPNYRPYKDRFSPEYSREYAEDCLYNTIDAADEHPVWTGNWSSRGGSEPPPDYQPGGPAPHWSDDEIVEVMEGPIMRKARQVFQRDKNGQQDAAQNAMLKLITVIRQRDWATDDPNVKKAGFVSWALSKVCAWGQGEMTAPTVEKRAHAAEEAITQLIGTGNPAAIHQIISSIEPPYTREATREQDPGNPFSEYSPAIYQLGSGLLQAINMQDEAAITKVRAALQGVLERVQRETIRIQGAHTGALAAFSKPKAFMAPGFTSTSRDSEGLGGVDPEDELAADPSEMGMDDTPLHAPTMTHVLELALNSQSWLLEDEELMLKVRDIMIQRKHAGEMAAWRALSPERQALKKEPIMPLAEEAKIAVNPLSLKQFRVFIRDPSNPFREGARTAGTGITEYPGRGVLRPNPEQSRSYGDAKANSWWMPGTDPELEPLPGGGKWDSIWLRKGCPITRQQAFANEMGDEALELTAKGVKVAAAFKIKKGGAPQANVKPSRMVDTFAMKDGTVWDSNQSDHIIGQLDDGAGNATFFWRYRDNFPPTWFGPYRSPSDAHAGREITHRFLITKVSADQAKNAAMNKISLVAALMKLAEADPKVRAALGMGDASGAVTESFQRMLTGEVGRILDYYVSSVFK